MSANAFIIFYYYYRTCPGSETRTFFFFGQQQNHVFAARVVVVVVVVAVAVRAVRAMFAKIESGYHTGIRNCIEQAYTSLRAYEKRRQNLPTDAQVGIATKVMKV